MDMGLDQILLSVTGVLAVFLTQQKHSESLKKYACILGLLGQPIWFYIAITNDMGGLFIIAIAYTYSWTLGVYNNWIKPYYEQKDTQL